jgi:hypothetical protein
MLMYVIMQCCTLDTNLHISRMQVGKMNGSKLRSASFARSMSAHMHTEAMRRMGKQWGMRGLLISYVIATISMLNLPHGACALLQETSSNIFDNIPALAKPILSRLRDELTAYLSSDPEYVDDVLGWWYEKRSMYPHLSRMALDYLTIPGMYSCLNKTDNY